MQFNKSNKLSKSLGSDSPVLVEIVGEPFGGAGHTVDKQFKSNVDTCKLGDLFSFLWY